jgi:hypothetical protein
MHPTIARMLVQDHQQELAREAAGARLAATGVSAKGSASGGTPAGARRWASSLALHLAAVVR